jgi:peptidoglycan/LPS O-acetylase OafA/YrhL
VRATVTIRGVDDAPSGHVVPGPKLRQSSVRPTAPATPRAPGVDALRAIAALMVVACHLSYGHVVDAGPLSHVVESGRHGVQIFFVLSGFLLVAPFLRGPVDLRVYGVRRLARIVPAYLLALVGITLLSGNRAFLDDPIRYALFLQQPGAPEVTMMPVAWSLQIEVAFYLCLPLLAMSLIWASGRRLGRGLLILCFVGVASWLIGHMLWLRASPTAIGSPLPPLMLPAELWAFIPGIAIAWMASRDARLLDRLARKRVAALGAVLLVLSFGGGQDAVLEIGAFDLIAALGAALLLPLAARSVRSVPRPVAVLATVGVVASYAIYLWHVDVIRAVERQGFTGLAGVPIALALTALIAGVSWMLVERPSLRWSDGVVAAIRRSRPATAAPLPPVVSVPEVAGNS